MKRRGGSSRTRTRSVGRMSGETRVESNGEITSTSRMWGTTVSESDLPVPDEALDETSYIEFVGEDEGEE